MVTGTVIDIYFKICDNLKASGYVVRISGNGFHYLKLYLNVNSVC